MASFSNQLNQSSFLGKYTGDDYDSEDSKDDEASLVFKTIPMYMVQQVLEKKFHFKDDIVNTESGMRQILDYRDIFSRFAIDKSQIQIADSTADAKSKMQLILEKDMKELMQTGINGEVDLPSSQRTWNTQLLYLKSYRNAKKEEESYQSIQKNLRRQTRVISDDKQRCNTQQLIYQQGFAMQDVSQWNQIKFDEMASTTKGQTRQLDLYLLKTASLILCRGTVQEKALGLVHLVTLNQNQSNSNRKLQWENENLKRTIKFMFYLCVVLPYKFMTEKHDNKIFKDMLFHQNTQFNTEEKRSSQKGQKKVDDFLNNSDEKQKFENAEKHFDDVFTNIYEERIIGYIFKNCSILSMEDFIFRISPKNGLLNFSSDEKKVERKKSNIHKPILPLNNDKDMLWLFSPVHLRKLFFEEMELYLQGHRVDQDEDDE